MKDSPNLKVSRERNRLAVRKCHARRKRLGLCRQCGKEEVCSVLVFWNGTYVQNKKSIFCYPCRKNRHK